MGYSSKLLPVHNTIPKCFNCSNLEQRFFRTICYDTIRPHISVKVCWTVEQIVETNLCWQFHIKL